MKINKELFVNYLLKATINDNIVEGTIDFNEKNICFNSTTPDNNVAINCTLDIKKIIDYKPLGKVSFNNLKLLRKTIARFGESFSIELRDNLVIISDDKKSCEILLVENDYIKVIPERIFTMEFTNNFQMDKSIINEAVQNAEALSLKEKIFYIDLEGDNIKITCGDYHSNRFIINEKIAGIVVKQSLIVGNYLAEVVNILSGTIKVFVEINKPLKITEDFNNGEIQTILFIALRVVNNDN